MPLASPVALLTVSDRPGTGLEARGPGATDGQFAGLMAQLTQAPNSTSSPQQAPAAPPQAEKGPKARPHKVRLSGAPTPKAASARELDSPGPATPPAPLKDASPQALELTPSQPIQAKQGSGSALPPGDASAGSQGSEETAETGVNLDTPADPTPSEGPIKRTAPDAQPLQPSSVVPPVPLATSLLGPLLQTQPAGSTPLATHPGAASTGSMAPAASAAATAPPTPQPTPPLPEQAPAIGPQAGLPQAAGSLAPEPRSPVRIGDSAPIQNTPSVPEPSEPRVQQPLPTQGQATAPLPTPPPALRDATAPPRIDESLAIRPSSLARSPLDHGVQPSELTPGGAVAPLGTLPPAPQEPPAPPQGRPSMEGPLGSAAPLLVLKSSGPEAQQPGPLAPWEALRPQTVGSVPEAPGPAPADAPTGLPPAPETGEARPTPPGAATPPSSAPAAEAFTRTSLPPAAASAAPGVQPPRRPELPEPSLRPWSTTFAPLEGTLPGVERAAATGPLAVVPSAAAVPPLGPSSPSAGQASEPLLSQGTTWLPGIAVAPAALAESTAALPTGPGRVVPPIATPEQAPMAALSARPDAGLPVNPQPAQAPAPAGPKPPAPAQPGAQLVQGPADHALPWPGLEPVHPAPAAPQAAGQKPELPAPLSVSRPTDGSSLAALTTLVRTTEATAPAAPAAPAPPTPPAPPALQVEGGLKWMLKGGAQEAQLQLHPESLGQVTIHLKVEGGEVHARLWITEPTSMQALRDGRPHLELSLREQGLMLGSFDLQQGSRPFQEATPAPVGRERSLPEATPTRQEAPAPLPISILNPHHVELYA